jgi:putative flippase GtrA
MDLVAAPTHHTALQVPRALVASVLAAALDFGTLVWLVERQGWSPVLAAVAGYLLGGVLQYVLCALWVFPAAPHNLTVGIVAFLVLSLVGLGITWATIAGLCDGLHVNYAVAKVVSLGLAFAWNFLSRKYLLFEPTFSPDIDETVLPTTDSCPAGARAELELQYEALATR